MDVAHPPHVLVIGAGITGLLIAQGLKKNGIQCTVFEAEPSASHYRPREWGMSIQWGLPLLRDCLPDELYDRLYTAAVDPYFEPPDPGVLPTLNGATGELLKNVPLLRMYRVSRRKFRLFCTEGIQVEYGKLLKDISYETENTVTATFEDGSTAVGTLLVGTDGAQSVVRTHIFGAEKARASTVPISAVNLHVKYNDAEKSKFVRQCHPVMTMGIHPDGYWLWISIQEVPDPDDPATWTFQLQTTWKRREGEEVASLENLKKKAETFGEPFRSANLWIPEGTKIYENRISYWEPIPWDNKNGRIVLAGDAAHPMTFQRGQGMNHGIADASKLTKCLKAAATGDATWQSAVDEYQAEMIDRAGDEVRTSFENTEMLHDWSRMQDSPIMQRGGNPREKAQASK
ncbi:putative fad binding domain-containing protein [Neofusicoccum parvum UCRNP2]|uniref:Putative fad binding domain-containing protein n=1 Tax=Botryosphaeria parva (strain UCR-NP2) TaxID=1287680 RepID=R1GAU1_BOTPV|nr:putative fad binding domain-containing protein [Neofusicoccum parvum UCRNP2]